MKYHNYIIGEKGDKKMKLKNYEIYNYTLALQNVFNDNEKYIL